MDSEDESNVPDRDTCQGLIEQFVSVTTSNEAVAQEFLQRVHWELEPAVELFYSELASEEMAKNTSVVELLYGPGKTVTNEPPPRLQLLSWNVDGLDENSLKRRMAAVVALVQKQEPDVIFFQEIIPEVADYFDRKLPEYKSVRGNSEGYFTMTLLRIFTIYYDSYTIENFSNSIMGRNLLVVKAHVGQRKFVFLNTHLESGKDFSSQRRAQLDQAFQYALSIPSETTVIFGGDLNLRDSEENIPDGFFDAWRACGSRQVHEFTWDMTRNTNNCMSGKFKPKLRFDRIYFRPEKTRVSPTHFGLVGAQRAPGTQRFPSDHWGVMVCFSLRHSS